MSAHSYYTWGEMLLEWVSVASSVDASVPSWLEDEEAPEDKSWSKSIDPKNAISLGFRLDESGRPFKVVSNDFQTPDELGKHSVPQNAHNHWRK